MNCDGFGHDGVGQFLVLEPRRLAAFHVADAADAVDDGAGVLLVGGLLEQLGVFEAGRFVADVLEVADLDGIGGIEADDAVILDPDARHAVHGGGDDVGIVKADFERAGFDLAG